MKLINLLQGEYHTDNHGAPEGLGSDNRNFDNEEFKCRQKQPHNKQILCDLIIGIDCDLISKLSITGNERVGGVYLVHPAVQENR